ncbi:MAG: cytochrome b/b6 domain-containing protein [Bacteroidetes bacterium]|nr:cytochrome b/b6 domain-containing protein [Bacteroidota bacterium]
MRVCSESIINDEVFLMYTVEWELRGAQMVGSYSFMATFMHWAFIGVFAFGVINQVDEVEELESSTLLVEEVIFAMIFLSLLLFRFIYMRSARAAMPQLDMPKNLILLARTVHLGMYVSLALIAITGLIIGGLYYFGVTEGLVLEVILLLHEIIFWTSVNLMGLHIAGAIYHRLKGDGVWSAMVPLLKEESAK